MYFILVRNGDGETYNTVGNDQEGYKTLAKAVADIREWENDGNIVDGEEYLVVGVEKAFLVRHAVEEVSK